MPDLYETYLRDVNGGTWYPKDFREGIDHFLSDEGYRISFNIDGVVIVIRRNPNVPVRRDFQFEKVVDDCSVTIR